MIRQTLNAAALLRTQRAWALAATALRANWRVCPMTGQLQQRWSLDDSQDPQSRGAALLLQQAGLIFGLYLGARTYP